ncbi:FAD-binding oxidoreductase [Kyrpidia spormannii]|uniref:D-lactate dehydrogenase (cytochrome) n=2 Tax=Kyrpidia spormannii TaxID=2055160 RepID=A0A6F9E5L5_9BACL|nr:FAD-linked oxidase C-terminal domain-containing protein [Kyrpidia spormannii]CAB3390881.1 2-hydroxy-acid oxidase [Kyrpidia spormannii]CAB3391791.1 2-hydroxy-acid oxidase [Kyrpidia spormannii]
MNVSSAIHDLRALLADPDRVTVNETILEHHSHDLTYHTPHLPEAVVFPTDTQEVSRIVRFANENGIPVVPFGVGSSLEGHVIPVRGGITLDLSRMNQILEIRPQDFLVRVQPGVTRSQLNQALRSHGLFFPVDPGADATLGGMAATNASGTNAVRYGAMRGQVLGLEVVLPDGRIIHTGGLSVKSSAGYYLTGLFVGSEGTLGVITEVILRVYGIPEHTAAARAVFPDVESAGRAAVALIGSGMTVGRVELVDAKTIVAVNRFKGTDYLESPTLFLEFGGGRKAVEEDIRLAEELVNSEGCQAFVYEHDPEAVAKLWEARHHAALALMAMAPGKKMMTTDVCVPISHLPGALHAARELMERRGMDGFILGHVGDGNYHAGFAVDADDPEDIARAEEVNAAIVRYALERGGTCTGEHGVGLGKRKYLPEEHGEAVELMRGIKALIDPKGIMNPGKVIPD